MHTKNKAPELYLNLYNNILLYPWKWQLNFYYCKVEFISNKEQFFDPSNVLILRPTENFCHLNSPKAWLITLPHTSITFYLSSWQEAELGISGILLPSHTFQLLAWSTEQLDMPQSLKGSIPEASQSGTWIALASSFWHVGAAALLYNFYPYVWVNLVSLSELSEADYWNFKTEVSQIHLEMLLYKSFGTGQNITIPISVLWGQGHQVYQSNFS